MELLAPAGDWTCLEAALEAGADAVYFGLRTLNARRRAKNFSQDEFVKAVEAAHARGAKAYLTLNIDLAQRELGQAARMLELARQSHADAILVRDPALLALRAEYPEIQFHLSTQTCMTSSADVAAAVKLGADRVVLARELTLAEIAAASAVPGVKTEVFVQGAMCFSVSGRCMLSSWVGGRSGNRGTCTSPCRVPWSVNEEAVNTPLSMKDLSAINRLPELRRAGVAALKIEGRLKNAAWVGNAVKLYKRALAVEINSSDPFLYRLGTYTGRTMTNGYLDGQREDLTGQNEGRQSTTNIPDESEVEASEEEESVFTEFTEDESNYDLSLTIEPKGIACTCVCGHRTDKWTIPKTVIHRPHKAIAIGVLFDQLGAKKGTGPFSNRGPVPFFAQLGRCETNDPEFLLTARAANALVDRISNTIRLAKKTPDDLVRIDLPPAVSDLLVQKKQKKGTGPLFEKGPVPFFSANRHYLGDKPDRVRLDAKTAAAFLRRVRPEGVIVEGLAGSTLHQMRTTCKDIALIVALPPVFFEDDIPAIKRLLHQCAEEGVTVEVNNWGGWRLAKAAKAAMEAGPGLAVLNSLAARFIAEKGMKCVTLSPEADRRQLEDLCSHCDVPCSLVVFGRPPLLTTRVEVPERFFGEILTDRRGVQIIPRREHGLYVFRPPEPFDLRGCVNERIRAKHLVADLIGSADPVADWHNIPLAEEKTFRFNYDRTLA